MNTLLKRILSVFGIKPKNVIYDYNPCKILTTKRALLYFKTSWYFSFNGKFNPPSGSTNFESYRTALALNKLGYLVTIVNRNTKTKLKGKFDLYYGLAVGESGRHFEYYFRIRFSNNNLN